MTPCIVRCTHYDVSQELLIPSSRYEKSSTGRRNERKDRTVVCWRAKEATSRMMRGTSTGDAIREGQKCSHNTSDELFDVSFVKLIQVNEEFKP